MLDSTTKAGVRLVGLAVAGNVRIGISEGQRNDRCPKKAGPSETGTFVFRKRQVPELLLRITIKYEQRPTLCLSRARRSRCEIDKIINQ